MGLYSVMLIEYLGLERLSSVVRSERVSERADAAGRAATGRSDPTGRPQSAPGHLPAGGAAVPVGRRLAGHAVRPEDMSRDGRRPPAPLLFQSQCRYTSTGRL